MKRWALVVAGLYMLALAVVALPVLMAAFGSWWVFKLPYTVTVKEALSVYKAWGFWVWVAVMGLCQIVLLALPVRVASRRPVNRRALWPTVLVSGLMAGLLFGAACSAIAEGVLGEAAIRDERFDPIGWAVLGAVLLTWIGWSAVFLRFARTSEPRDLIGRQFRWMFRGSVLELLIAVPMHVIARHRDYCCAAVMTFFGLGMGIAVMLFAFGPSVFFLYADRWRRLHPPADPPAANGV